MGLEADDDALGAVAEADVEVEVDEEEDLSADFELYAGGEAVGVVFEVAEGAVGALLAVLVEEVVAAAEEVNEVVEVRGAGEHGEFFLVELVDGVATGEELDGVLGVGFVVH